VGLASGAVVGSGVDPQLATTNETIIRLSNSTYQIFPFDFILSSSDSLR
jgi:hypothetical protein